MIRIFPIALALASTSIVQAQAQKARFTAITGGENVGRLWVDTQRDRTTVNYDMKNNGRRHPARRADRRRDVVD